MRSNCAGRADVAFEFAADRRPGSVHLFGDRRNAYAVPTELGDLDPLVFGQIAGTDPADGEAVKWDDGLDCYAVPVNRVTAGAQVLPDVGPTNVGERTSSATPDSTPLGYAYRLGP
ncbi:hypothetical protein JOE26_000204 [Rhodococcus coprophilus]|uniref:Uncharacterized protein n=1 Tax=Rhodococcus coprophilus TaxID=38310 RepID=A0A2X4UAR9_9NOCA|nr:hypothetical protein [Rhodococcus coprophilus]SQI29900.1 Uncharacterised protein [Rhodococcus coprophilus]